jgi:ferric-dicitrate binding protein FerR (iron transport regulator)
VAERRRRRLRATLAAAALATALLALAALAAACGGSATPADTLTAGRKQFTLVGHLSDGSTTEATP